MNNKTRLDLQKAADDALIALTVYKTALEAFFETRAHVGCFEMKRDIIGREFTKVDKTITEIITGGDHPSECAIAGFHVAVLEHAVFNIEHVMKTTMDQVVEQLVQASENDKRIRSDEEKPFND